MDNIGWGPGKQGRGGEYADDASFKVEVFERGVISNKIQYGHAELFTLVKYM